MDELGYYPRRFLSQDFEFTLALSQSVVKAHTPPKGLAYMAFQVSTHPENPWVCDSIASFIPCEQSESEAGLIFLFMWSGMGLGPLSL